MSQNQCGFQPVVYSTDTSLRALNSLSRLLHKYPDGEDRGYVDTAVAIFGGRLVIAANNRDDTSFRAEIFERMRLLQRYFDDTDTEANDNFVIQRILPATIGADERTRLTVRLTTDLKKVRARLPRELLAEDKIALASKAFRRASGLQVHAEMDIMAHVINSRIVLEAEQHILVGNTKLACFHCDKKFREHNHSRSPYRFIISGAHRKTIPWVDPLSGELKPGSWAPGYDGIRQRHDDSQSPRPR
ncbi:MAG: hypothetical protein KBD25_03065 [Rickettsiaceae bacterium]|nr:hypothetical protein [Rickettsiaceae bacterium]